MTDAVGKVTIRTDEGLRDFKTCTQYDANAKDAKDNITFDNKNYTRVKLSDGKYHYILPDGGKNTNTSKPEKEYDGGWFFSWDSSKYDQIVDMGFGKLDDVMGITEADEKILPPEEDDGKISGFEKCMRFLKGGPIAMLKGMVKHPILTAAAAVAFKAVAGIALFGGAITVGTGLLVAGLVVGACVLGYGIYKACSDNTKTDAEARNAWENIGSGATTVALCASSLIKSAPKDGTYRPLARKIADGVQGQHIDPSKDNIINSTGNWFHRRWYAPEVSEQTMSHVNSVAEQANQAINMARLSDAKTLISDLSALSKCQPLAGSKTEIIAQIDKLQTALDAAKVAHNIPWSKFMLSQDALWNNLFDSSATDIQNAYRNAPALAE
ncbi:MAG: hypothetical protein MJ180_04920 [Candidatus Gastranaerophilales bacterium]|nr:hypothetical protein [Candidatus Gastranaerophilales bacterium]